MRGADEKDLGASLEVAQQRGCRRVAAKGRRSGAAQQRGAHGEPKEPVLAGTCAWLCCAQWHDDAQGEADGLPMGSDATGRTDGERAAGAGGDA